MILLCKNKTSTGKLILLGLVSGIVLFSHAITDLNAGIHVSSASDWVALVIGNSQYQSAPLKNPGNDSRAMATVLKDCGFVVTLIIDATKREMDFAVREFGRSLNSNTVGLFYYAGHGMQLKGRNYLIPIDALIESESDVEYEALDAGRVLGKMEDAENRLNIVILDACRNNPFVRNFRSPNLGLARMDAPTGSIIAYATGPGKLASDGEKNNGVYTHYLIQNIKKPNLTIERILKNVRIAVMDETSKKQVPWESSSLTGDFYFNETIQQEQMTKTIETSPTIEKNGLDSKQIQQPGEKGHLQLAAIPEPEFGPNDTIRQGEYIKYKTGIVYDESTGVEWLAGPDKELSWSEAKAWISSLNKTGFKWRMPTEKELRSLYKRGVGSKNMTPLLETNSWWIWYKKGVFYGSRDAFNFYYGPGTYSNKNKNISKHNKTFAVRDRIIIHTKPGD